MKARGEILVVRQAQRDFECQVGYARPNPSLALILSLSKDERGPTEGSRLDQTPDDPELIFAAEEPIALFSAWLSAAEQTEPNDANAMCLATVDAAGLPDARMVLLKGHGEDGFVFYTNLESTKGAELAANPKAALLFHWKSLRRQVRVRGTVQLVGDAEADAYFASRHPQSRIGAWASAQSRPLESREALEARASEFAERFGEIIPRPPNWSGFRLQPREIEFWRDGAHRLHDRFLFKREGRGGWSRTRLNP